MEKVCEIVRTQLALPPESELTPESKFSALGADSLDTVSIPISLPPSLPPYSLLIIYDRLVIIIIIFIYYLFVLSEEVWNDQVEIVMGLEAEFDIVVEEDSSQNITTVREAADLIEKLLEKKTKAKLDS